MCKFNNQMKPVKEEFLTSSIHRHQITLLPNDATDILRVRQDGIFCLHRVLSRESDARFSTSVFFINQCNLDPKYVIRIVSTFFENSRDNRE
jgi:hypothetical protein